MRMCTIVAPFVLAGVLIAPRALTAQEIDAAGMRFERVGGGR
jgi:hypothetical protein